jgi:hypothetical protein
VLTAILILSIVVGSVTAIYGAAMRSWYQGATLTYAQQKSSWAVNRMVPDLQQGISLTAASSPYDTICIAVRLPNKTFVGGAGAYLNEVQTDATGAPYLVEGNWAVYYRGDEYGGVSLYGDRIWRVVTDSSGTVLKTQQLADNVVDNPDDGTGSPKPMFVYWPDIYHLRSVEVTVTVEEKRGGRVEQSTMNAQITLRNN